MTKTVRVYRAFDEGPRLLHKGIVLARTNSFAKVYDSSKDSGDTNVDSAQWYPIKSKKCWIEGLTS